MTIDRLDFEGNHLRSERDFAEAYKDVPDWSADPAMETETFDGLNRPIDTEKLDGSTVEVGYETMVYPGLFTIRLPRPIRAEFPAFHPKGHDTTCHLLRGHSSAMPLASPVGLFNGRDG